MFTGLIEEIGTLLETRAFPGGRRLRFSAPATAGGLSAGDSIACNGVCLTVEASDARAGRFAAAAVAETLRRTTAGGWRPGARIHLERALRADGRLGGHWVQGHVDGLGRVVRCGRRGQDQTLAIAVPAGLARYLAAKGSLAVDGVSLTVGALRGAICELYIVPETCARTLLARLRPGARVNLEVDILAKYTEALLSARGAARGRGEGGGSAW
ncbi:MAG: riboflavin synthase [Candidatus Eisenbacteria bacterium]|uniref:Riboflavin synthase n=1 Tax=Eiseniibacteriota bacterium TaxID=2212470 RepID=A0A937X6E6_UNCEI|nr:riboflavin synthase [Candidatus Eisenbacteria bacterium]